MRSTSPSSQYQERQRRELQSSQRDLSRTTRHTHGYISEVHAVKPLVKIILKDGANAAGGAWLPVINAALEIINNWGKL